jgi:hypothetical protein
MTNLGYGLFKLSSYSELYVDGATFDNIDAEDGGVLYISDEEEDVLYNFSNCKFNQI